MFYQIAFALVLAATTTAQAATVPQWQKPGPTDVRSPCPLLNAMANHGLLPRDGKNIKATQYISALTSISIGLDLASALVVGSPAVGVPTHLSGLTFTFGLDDLRTHGAIEHDASLTRNDAYFGDNYSFNHTLYDQFISTQNAAGRLDVNSMAKIRALRLKQSKATNPDNKFGFKESTLAHGEASLILNYFGYANGLEIPTNYLDAVFVDERLPYNEGWVPPTSSVNLLKVSAVSKQISDAEAKLPQ
ncbi:Chloroperoxidase [Fimicolochytrium jonesii]|uniref:Chloroperoxidase n=1 Tax=Fimicolochytrium jonesii TaxID=1396493 RepID=UPI0022FEF755|nr:Chloroperoxidase [Fimicolochytrium jonesii]KAI8823031.1 Chloroperoxidase [Fimicolochytrium jonesii]